MIDCGPMVSAFSQNYYSSISHHNEFNHNNKSEDDIKVCDVYILWHVPFFEFISSFNSVLYNLNRSWSWMTLIDGQ